MHNSEINKLVTAEKTRVKIIEGYLERIRAISQIDITILVHAIRQQMFVLLEYYQERKQNNSHDLNAHNMYGNVQRMCAIFRDELSFHNLGNNIFKLYSYNTHARQLPNSLHTVVDSFHALEVTDDNAPIIRELLEWVTGRYEKYESVARRKNIKIEPNALAYHPAISMEDRFYSYFSRTRQLDLAEPMRKLAGILHAKLSLFEPTWQTEKLVAEENHPQILLQASVRIGNT